MVKYFIMAKYVDSRSYKTDIIWLPWPHSSNVRFKYTSAHHIDNMLIFFQINGATWSVQSLGALFSLLVFVAI